MLEAGAQGRESPYTSFCTVDDISSHWPLRGQVNGPPPHTTTTTRKEHHGPSPPPPPLGSENNPRAVMREGGGGGGGGCALLCALSHCLPPCGAVQAELLRYLGHYHPQRPGSPYIMCDFKPQQFAYTGGDVVKLVDADMMIPMMRDDKYRVFPPKIRDQRTWLNGRIFAGLPCVVGEAKCPMECLFGYKRFMSEVRCEAQSPAANGTGVCPGVGRKAPVYTFAATFLRTFLETHVPTPQLADLMTRATAYEETARPTIDEVVATLEAILAEQQVAHLPSLCPLPLDSILLLLRPLCCCLPPALFINLHLCLRVHVCLVIVRSTHTSPRGRQTPSNDGTMHFVNPVFCIEDGPPHCPPLLAENHVLYQRQGGYGSSKTGVLTWR